MADIAHEVASAHLGTHFSNEYALEFTRRSNWLRILARDIVNKCNGPSDRELRIGLIGALGAADVGDEAMLVADMNDLRSVLRINQFVVFSNKASFTEEYLKLPSYPTLFNYLYDRRNWESVLSYGIGRLEDTLSFSFAHLLGYDPLQFGGYWQRAYFRRKIDCILRSIAEEKAGSVIASPLVRDHVERLKGLDALVYIGGGYLSSGHMKEKNIAVTAAARIAALLGKPVYASGLSIGPLNKIDRRFLAPVLASFALIGMRDHHESFDELSRMKIFDPAKHMYSCDDATFLESSSDVPESVDRFQAKGAYVAVQVHRWTLETDQYSSLMEMLASELGHLLESSNLNIVFVPMRFRSSRMSDDRVHAELATRIERLVPQAADRLLLPPVGLSPQSLKYIYSKARAAVVTRHHALLFSCSSGVPSLGIVYDRYYFQKLRGIQDAFPSKVTLKYIAQTTGSVIRDFLASTEWRDDRMAS